jgi:hypothetical protein
MCELCCFCIPLSKNSRLASSVEALFILRILELHCQYISCATMYAFKYVFSGLNVCFYYRQFVC